MLHRFTTLLFTHKGDLEGGFDKSYWIEMQIQCIETTSLKSINISKLLQFRSNQENPVSNHWFAWTARNGIGSKQCTLQQATEETETGGSRCPSIQTNWISLVIYRSIANFLNFLWVQGRFGVYWLMRGTVSVSWEARELPV